MVNNMQKIDFIQLMLSAISVIEKLNLQGVIVKSVALTSGKPVIRIQRCTYCDKLVEKGKAVYLEFGCNSGGRYRQGQFAVGDCKVIWSESLH